MIFFQAENKQICLYTTLVSTDPQYFVPESCTGQKLFKCIFEIHIIEKGTVNTKTFLDSMMYILKHNLTSKYLLMLLQLHIFLLKKKKKRNR